MLLYTVTVKQEHKVCLLLLCQNETHSHQNFEKQWRAGNFIYRNFLGELVTDLST